jgi:hypothetical protein
LPRRNPLSVTVVVRWLALAVAVLAYATHPAWLVYDPPAQVDGLIPAGLLLGAGWLVVDGLLERHRRQLTRRLDDLEDRLISDRPTQPQVPLRVVVAGTAAVVPATYEPCPPPSNVVAFDLGRRAERYARGVLDDDDR